MTQFLNIPESYKDITTAAIKGLGCYNDTVICTTDKKLLTFFKGCLMKNCNVEIEVKHLEPFIVYNEPEVEVYYILHGDNKVVIVKEETSLKIITTYSNVYEMIVNDHNNSGTPQLYMRTDKGFESVDNFENKEQISSIHQETSVVYTFCVNKLQNLKTLYDTERNRLSQKTSSFISAVMQISNDTISDVNLLSNVVTKNSWLKLSNENLVYGFTLQNISKLSVSNFNIILLEDSKQIWSKFRYECWAIEKNKSGFNFYSGHENTCISKSIQKSSVSLNSESSTIITIVIDNWNTKSLPYFINGMIYTNNKNDNMIEYINSDKIMVTANLFLDKEFDIFVKNGVFVEDLVTLRCTKLISCYQIKNTMCLEDLKNMMINNFKFNIKHNWFVHSSLSWLRTIVCYLDLVSPLEYILKVYSDSLGLTKTFIQVLTTMLSEHTIINYLDTKVPTYYNMDTAILDLRDLRRIFKKYLNKQIIIPRDQWNITRCKLLFT
ncbi:uncharacterized protein LOC114121216 isoform X1 [Aphis gossypii]|uniref:Uncharacterized protein n=2 Tax=Aphis gossypii TaxID=80765 RepID=A0A9P0JAG0_APHGO|nr:uncharacterized protein LOC114121216 isoform X1 [Aphis gossypii]XP_050060438.1 uncharacterized protein LOC114121216 isoform X1 [Aphis gossypii]CAH1736230.1 unnamed protein product [Aphis gossypii]